MTTAVKPWQYLADPSVRPFSRTRRVDLLAPDVPVINGEETVVYENLTKPGEIEVVRYIVPFAQRRTDVGTPQESVEMISNVEAEGFFAFSPKVNGQTAFIIDADLNTPRPAAGPLSNAERQIRGAITFISGDPWIDSQRYNPLFSVPVPSDATFSVTFALLPPSTVAPLPNPFTIGGVGGTKRVDFAGVVISGIVMPQQLYDRMLTEAEQGNSDV